MKNSISKLVVAAVLGAGSAGWAAPILFGPPVGDVYTATSPGAQAIPDYPGSGVAYALSFTGPSTLTDIMFTFTTSGGTAWNGDLYAYLSHGAGSAILLNRVGAPAVGTDGYGTAGFPGITLAMTGGTANIHDVQFPTAGGGPYTADGTGGSTLSVFNGVNPNGSWILYFEDQAALNVSSLDSWTLNITTVPEPATWVLGMFGALAGAVKSMQWRRRERAVVAGPTE